MLLILKANGSVNEIAVNPGLRVATGQAPSRGGSERLSTDTSVHRIIPLVLPRKAVKGLIGLHMPVSGSMEVLERMEAEDKDPSSPVLLSYVSNVELNSLMTLASRLLRLAVSKSDAQLQRFADSMFDALGRAQGNAANSPVD